MLQAVVVVGKHFGQFYLNGHVVVVLVGGQGDEVVIAQFLEVHQDLLYLDGEDIDATQHHHIIATATHAVQTDMVAPAGTRAAKHAGEVAGAVAQQRHGLAAQRGEHQLANLAVGHGLQCLGVNNLNDIIVLPEVQAVLLGALEAYAGAAHLAHTEGVVGLYPQHVLNTLALLLAVRLCTDGEHLQFSVAARIDALLLHHLVEAGDV